MDYDFNDFDDFDYPRQDCPLDGFTLFTLIVIGGILIAGSIVELLLNQ